MVITDRVILDRQLQDTIYQFEHARGVVVKIDEDSTQLAQALAGEQARIIITTLQKFPFVIGKIGEVPARNYAVVIDEAHSSQTGEAAKDLRLALGGCRGAGTHRGGGRGRRPTLDGDRPGGGGSRALSGCAAADVSPTSPTSPSRRLRRAGHWRCSGVSTRKPRSTSPSTDGAPNDALANGIPLRCQLTSLLTPLPRAVTQAVATTTRRPKSLSAGRVARGRRAVRRRIAGTSAIRWAPVGEQADAVAEQGGGAASVPLPERVGDDPADRSRLSGSSWNFDGDPGGLKVRR